MLRIDPSKTALIVQDMQNDVLSDGGAWADSGAPLHANPRMLWPTCAACGRSSPAGNTCHPCALHRGAWRSGTQAERAPFQGLKEVNALVRGTWGAAPVEGLEPASGDFVVEKIR